MYEWGAGLTDYEKRVLSRQPTSTIYDSSESNTTSVREIFHYQIESGVKLLFPGFMPKQKESHQGKQSQSE